MSKIIERALTHKAVLIAEIGVNYYDIAKKMNISNMEAAKLMIKKAKDAGIHAVKFRPIKLIRWQQRILLLTGIPRKRQQHPSMSYFRNLTSLAKKNIRS